MNTNVKLKALCLNCTIKYSPEISNTEALSRKLITRMEEIYPNLEAEYIRVTDYNIKFGGGINDINFFSGSFRKQCYWKGQRFNLAFA